MSLGIKLSVISLIWVAAWNMLTSSPTTSAGIRITDTSNRITCNACWKMVKMLSGVIAETPSCLYVHPDSVRR